MRTAERGGCFSDCGCGVVRSQHAGPGEGVGTHCPPWVSSPLAGLILAGTEGQAHSWLLGWELQDACGITPLFSCAAFGCQSRICAPWVPHGSPQPHPVLFCRELNLVSPSAPVALPRHGHLIAPRPVGAEGKCCSLGAGAGSAATGMDSLPAAWVAFPMGEGRGGLDTQLSLPLSLGHGLLHEAGHK